MSKGMRLGSLEIEVSRANDILAFVWIGEAGERNPVTTIRPFLDGMCQQEANGVAGILVDLTRLEFMNSSCIGLIVTFVKALDADNKKVEVRFDTRQKWQDLSRRCTQTIFARTDNVVVSDVCEN